MFAYFAYLYVYLQRVFVKTFISINVMDDINGVVTIDSEYLFNDYDDVDIYHLQEEENDSEFETDILME